MEKERNRGWFTKQERTKTVATACALSLTPTEAREPVKATWMTMQKTTCHRSWLRREKIRTSEIPATGKQGSVSRTNNAAILEWLTVLTHN